MIQWPFQFFLFPAAAIHKNCYGNKFSVKARGDMVVKPDHLQNRLINDGASSRRVVRQSVCVVVDVIRAVPVVPDTGQMSIK